jgi:Uma2 family endonuclease
MSVPLPRRRFTVEDYHRMGEAGIFAEDDRVELIEGEIFEMTPIGSRHAGCVNRLVKLFQQTVGERALLSVQNPVRLERHSELQPDVALLLPRADFYTASHLGPKDVLLLVEVVESSASYDRGVKVPLYARAGIEEVWLVDLTGGYVEVYRNPAGGGYAEVLQLRRDDRLVPAAFPDVVVAVEDVLGPDL